MGLLILLSQAHKLHDDIHDIELTTLDARTVGEVTINCSILFTLCIKTHTNYSSRGFVDEG